MQTATGLILLGLFMFQGEIAKGKPNVFLNCSEPQDPVYSGQNVSVNCSTITDNENCMFYRVSGFRDRSKRLNCTGKSENMTVHSGMYRFGIYVEIHNVTNPGIYKLDFFFFDCGVESNFSFNVTVQEKPDTQQFGTDSTPLQTHLYVGLFVGALVALMVVALIIYGIRRSRNNEDNTRHSQTQTVKYLTHHYL